MVQNDEKNPFDEVLVMSAVGLSKSVNANIGITVGGKACLFKKEVLEFMSEKMPDGQELQIGHLIEICRQEGHEINDDRFCISLNARDMTEDEWLESLNKSNEEENEDDCEEEYDEWEEE